MLIDCRRQVFEYLFEKKDALLIILPVGYGKSLFYHKMLSEDLYTIQCFGTTFETLAEIGEESAKVTNSVWEIDDNLFNISKKIDLLLQSSIVVRSVVHLVLGLWRITV